jgi:protein-disulfide isomerase
MDRRRLWLWVAALALAGCAGTVTQLATREAASAPRWTSVALSPLRVTMPEGRVIALAADGAITFDGELRWTLTPDGRLVDTAAEPVATLLPDGRISHRRELSSWRVDGDRVLDGAAPAGADVIASLEGATLQLPSGVHVPVLDLTADNRATLLYLVAVERRELAHVAALEAEAEDDDTVRYRVPVDGAPSRGPDDALVTIVAFEDFQCPFCGRAHGTLARILEEYPSDVRVVYRHQPLPFHQNAMPAAEASMEAFVQRGPAGFWAMHDLLFENQQALDRASLERYAAQVGLDLPRFTRALDEHPHRARILADSELGNRIGANGTPAFFINGVELMGAQPFEAFAGVIDREREHARRLVAAGVPRGRLYERVIEHGLTRAEPPPAVAAAAPRRTPDPRAVYRVPIDGAPVLGPDDALVTVVVFSDFQCPFCSRVEPTLAQLRSEYGRDLRIVWMNNPLPFHQNAEPAAEAAMEIFAQTGARGFWAFHDLLFENQQHLERADLERYAATIRGVHMRHFRAALDGHSHRAAIEANQALARSLGASGTPSFFINGRNLRGAQPIESFRTLIDEVRSQAQARVASGTPRARVYAETIAAGATEPVLLPAPAAAP